jgi:membrane dipeptidase
MIATESVVQPAISERAAKLHRDAIVIDGLSFYYDGPTSRFDPDKLTALNLTACETYNAWDRALEEIMQVREDLKRDPVGVLIRSAADIEVSKVNRKVGVILGVQSTIFIDTELWHLDLLYDIGLRIMQLTYNERSYMGDGCLEADDGGLSRFGRRAIARVEDLGIALDLSHVGRRTSLDAIAAASVPIMFSHANPNKVTQNPRNLTDEQIKAVGENGGMIGVCTWGPLCWKNDPTKRPTVNDVIDHIDYVVDMIGIDHVGIGTDSACTTNTAWLIQHSLEFNSAYPEIANEFVSHHGRSSGMPEINTLDRMTDGLLNRGYTDGEVVKVIGGNFLRHFRTAWRA